METIIQEMTRELDSKLNKFTRLIKSGEMKINENRDLSLVLYDGKNYYGFWTGNGLRSFEVHNWNSPDIRICGFGEKAVKNFLEAILEKIDAKPLWVEEFPFLDK